MCRVTGDANAHSALSFQQSYMIFPRSSPRVTMEWTRRLPFQQWEDTSHGDADATTNAAIITKGAAIAPTAIGIGRSNNQTEIVRSRRNAAAKCNAKPPLAKHASRVASPFSSAIPSTSDGGVGQDLSPPLACNSKGANRRWRQQEQQRSRNHKIRFGSHVASRKQQVECHESSAGAFCCWLIVAFLLLLAAHCTSKGARQRLPRFTRVTTRAKRPGGFYANTEKPSTIVAQAQFFLFWEGPLQANMPRQKPLFAPPPRNIRHQMDALATTTATPQQHQLDPAAKTPLEKSKSNAIRAVSPWVYCCATWLPCSPLRFIFLILLQHVVLILHFLQGCVEIEGSTPLER
jgi:hypothetical protein